MSFYCTACDYLTKRKSSFDRHELSRKHLINLAIYKKRGTKQSPSALFQCEKCARKFSHASSLSRHKKTCEIENSGHELNKQTFSKDFEEIMNRPGFKEAIENIVDKKVDQKLKEQEKEPQTINTYINIHQFIRDFNAPLLGPLNECQYELLGQEEKDYHLVEVLLDHYDKKNLKQYLSKFLINHYKKKDPSEQSLWTSDLARLTYFIRNLDNGDKPVWQNDKGGKRTMEKIIKPLLNFIKQEINNYEELCEERRKECLRKNRVNEQYEITKKLQKTQKIKYDINNDILAMSILRYIAPTFNMNQADIPIGARWYKVDREGGTNKRVLYKRT